MTLVALLMSASAAHAHGLGGGIFCTFPEACHQGECFDTDAPMLIAFPSHGDDSFGVFIETQRGAIPAELRGVSGDGTVRFEATRVDGLAPIRSVIVHKERPSVISLWGEGEAADKSTMYEGRCSAFSGSEDHH